MPQVFIGLGSNLGDRRDYLHRALTALKSVPQITFKKCSSVYETEPVGLKEQPQFLNMVAELNSSLPPHNILKRLKEIEIAIGRTNAERWGPREIDLDLLYYGEEILNDEELRVPHPEIANRRFILVPMKEIAGRFHDPVWRQNIGELLRHCSDTSAVRKISKSINLQHME